MVERVISRFDLNFGNYFQKGDIVKVTSDFFHISGEKVNARLQTHSNALCILQVCALMMENIFLFIISPASRRRILMWGLNAKVAQSI